MADASCRRRRRVAAAVGAVVAVVALVSGCTAGASTVDRAADVRPAPRVEGAPFRAFSADSWWNTPVPDGAPSNPDAAGILRYMSTGPESGGGCLRLAGAGDSPWGQPVYWAEPGDPTYDVVVDKSDPPPEVRHLRIPTGAEAADNNDGSMTIFDLDRGYVVALTDASYDAAFDSWRASGATVTYLHSNGLDARVPGSNDPRNQGSHRGNNGAVMMARFDEVAAGQIDHVLKVASGPEVSVRAVFPMVNSDGDSSDPDAPPQGLRFRIKPSVDLQALGLQPQALVIATALQRYGFYIGDSGGVTALKLQDIRQDGPQEQWNVSADALCGLPFTPQYWDVLPEGYGSGAAG